VARHSAGASGGCGWTGGRSEWPICCEIFMAARRRHFGVMLDGSTLGRCLVAGGLRSGHGSRAMMAHGDVSYLIFFAKTKYSSYE
jgi:hypothetical protein